jgi:16S rRNA processing protein RimM
MPMQDLVVVATIGRPRGLQGECHLHAQGRTLEAAKLPLQVEVAGLAGARSPMVLCGARTVSGGLLGRFEGVNTPEQVGTLTNSQVLVDRSKLPQLGDGEYYQFELEGMRVVDGGRELGTVRRVENFPTLDALEVQWHNGRVVLVPLTKAVLRRVDRQERCIEVDSAALEELELDR